MLGSTSVFTCIPAPRTSSLIKPTVRCPDRCKTPKGACSGLGLASHRSQAQSISNSNSGKRSRGRPVCSHPSPALGSEGRHGQKRSTASQGLTARAMDPATQELHDFILQCPLFSSCGFTPDTLDMGEWVTTGKQLALQLNFDHDNLTPIQRLRIYHYYLPIYFWTRAQLQAHQASGATTALVLGISAPQGCGKTTVVEQLVQLFTWAGKRAASVSIDDFYLTYADQTALGAANPSNRLLQYRGNAGTHDLVLGSSVLQALRGLTQPGVVAMIPRYDKSAFAGRGDRAPNASWQAVQGPLDIVLFEGWMLGFAPLSDDDAAKTPEIAEINKHLHAYKDAWDALVDSWLVIRIGDPQWVYKWRLQAEEAMRALGKPGLTDEQVADFVSRFQPAYSAYLQQLYSAGPTTCRPGRTLVVEVDQDRAPVANQPPPFK